MSDTVHSLCSMFCTLQPSLGLVEIRAQEQAQWRYLLERIVSSFTFLLTSAADLFRLSFWCHHSHNLH